MVINRYGNNKGNCQQTSQLRKQRKTELNTGSETTEQQEQRQHFNIRVIKLKKVKKRDHNCNKMLPLQLTVEAEVLKLLQLKLNIIKKN